MNFWTLILTIDFTAPLIFDKRIFGDNGDIKVLLIEYILYQYFYLLKTKKYAWLNVRIIYFSISEIIKFSDNYFSIHYSRTFLNKIFIQVLSLKSPI